jgi:spore maturation protein CgeB
MYKDYDDFKQKLEYYLSHDDIREEMAKRAQKITLEKFTNEKIAQKFIDIFKNIKK